MSLSSIWPKGANRSQRATDGMSRRRVCAPRGGDAEMVPQDPDMHGVEEG